MKIENNVDKVCCLLTLKNYYYETNLYIITKHFSYDIIRAE